MPIERPQWRSEVIDTDDRFFNLQNEWQAFQESKSDPQSSPFLSWDWLYLWWTIYRRPHWRLAIGLIRCNEQLVAIFPFYIKKMGLIQLHFLGTGEPESEEVVTEYLDCLLGDDVDIQRHAQQWLEEFLHKIDIVVFERMLVTAKIIDMMSLVKVFPIQKHIDKGCRYYLGLQDDSSIEKKFNSNLRRKYRKFQLNSSDDQWQFERCEDPQQLDFYFSELKRLHELRWHSKGKQGAFSSQRFLQFHRTLAEKLLAKGRLYLGLLSIRGEIAGCLYTIDTANVRYFYQAGFLPAMQQLAPGHISHFLAIDDAQKQGFTHYDFMLGGVENSYKAEYTSPGELVVSYIAAKKKWKMIVYQLGSKIMNRWATL
jgi:CelD/BcsL family acetyltransferase involved in cellulose biosynthesis